MKSSTRERERMERKQDILNAAIELFCKKGFEQSSMDDVAKESEYTKKTIYRYFTCKEDLFFAVTLEGYQRLSGMIALAHTAHDNGIGNIRRSYSAFYEFYCKYPQLLQCMTMVGLIKPYSANLNVPYRDQLERHTAEMFQSVRDLFVAAKGDGSIRSDLDVTQLAYSSIFFVTGFFALFSQSGSSFARFLGMGEEAFALFCIDRLMDSLAAQEKDGLP